MNSKISTYRVFIITNRRTFDECINAINYNDAFCSITLNLMPDEEILFKSVKKIDSDPKI